MIEILQFILHIDTYINLFVQQYGIWTYVILFLIIFIETGLVFVPFLPGDSLLFVVGTLAAVGSFNLFYLLILLSIAAILGDTVNYWIGHHFGNKILQKYVKKEYLQSTEDFYKKHGHRTIIIARFVPIIRTFAPFVAGIGKMEYKKFLFYNVIGGIVWVFVFTIAGFLFGNVPFVKSNISMILIGIIVISLLATLRELLHFRKTKEIEVIVD